MFVMEILQEIVINFSFDTIRTVASFSGDTLAAEVQTNRRLKLPKISESDENSLLFLLQGR